MQRPPPPLRPCDLLLLGDVADVAAPPRRIR
jgi:hypothetical protein